MWKSVWHSVWGSVSGITEFTDFSIREIVTDSIKIPNLESVQNSVQFPTLNSLREIISEMNTKQC
jgi:hypothetical protein